MRGRRGAPAVAGGAASAPSVWNRSPAWPDRRAAQVPGSGVEWSRRAAVLASKTCVGQWSVADQM